MRKKIKAFFKKFPLIWEIYMCINARILIQKRRKAQKKIDSMKNEELEQWLTQLYHDYQGEHLDWNNLRTMTEKTQWAKIYDKDPRKTICADKYAVRDWVKERIGEDYLIPLLGVWEQYKDIDFNTLPEKFVLKTNHGAGEAVIVKNKSQMSLAEKIRMRRRIEFAMAVDYSSKTGELHYRDIPHKIIAEKLIETENGDLPDYKFYCFDGIPYYVWIDIDRFTDHRRNVYDMNWVLQEWNQKKFKNTSYAVEKPENFEKMIDIAKTLSEGFSHVRIDLYNVKGKIYFGEMTFTSGSGFSKITPRSADEMLGDLWKLDMTNKQ